MIIGVSIGTIEGVWLAGLVVLIEDTGGGQAENPIISQNKIIKIGVWIKNLYFIFFIFIIARK